MAAPLPRLAKAPRYTAIPSTYTFLVRQCLIGDRWYSIAMHGNGPNTSPEKTKRRYPMASFQRLYKVGVEAATLADAVRMMSDRIEQERESVLRSKEQAAAAASWLRDLPVSMPTNDG